MKWPEKVHLWLKERDQDKARDYTSAELYEAAYEAMEGTEPEEIIKDCEGKYSTFAYDPVVTCPICEEDKKENECALALFYTSEIILESWT